MVVAAVNSQSPCDQVPFVDRAGWGAREPTEITNLTGNLFHFMLFIILTNLQGKDFCIKLFK